MNIVLFGPPGAGKGTQSDNLLKEFNLFKISTGDILRDEIKKKSTLGMKIKSIIDSGLLVSDITINDFIENILSNKSYCNRLIFDGYPRNLNQARNLDSLMKKYKQTISCVFCLKVNKNVVIKRILGRQICSKCKKIFNKFLNPSTEKNHLCDFKYLQTRDDDNEKTIMNRFDTYSKDTFPIIEHYKKLKLLYEIDGISDISKIYEEIRAIIHSLET